MTAKKVSFKKKDGTSISFGGTKKKAPVKKSTKKVAPKKTSSKKAPVKKSPAKNIKSKSQQRRVAETKRVARGK